MSWDNGEPISVGHYMERLWQPAGAADTLMRAAFSAFVERIVSASAQEVAMYATLLPGPPMAYNKLQTKNDCRRSRLLEWSIAASQKKKVALESFTLDELKLLAHPFVEDADDYKNKMLLVNALRAWYMMSSEKRAAAKKAKKAPKGGGVSTPNTSVGPSMDKTCENSEDRTSAAIESSPVRATAPGVETHETEDSRRTSGKRKRGVSPEAAAHTKLTFGGASGASFLPVKTEKEERWTIKRSRSSSVEEPLVAVKDDDEVEETPIPLLNVKREARDFEVSSVATSTAFCHHCANQIGPEMSSTAGLTSVTSSSARSIERSCEHNAQLEPARHVELLLAALSQRHGTKEIKKGAKRFLACY